MNAKEQRISDWAYREATLMANATEDEQEKKLYLNAYSAVNQLAKVAEENSGIPFEKLRDTVINMLFWQPLAPIEEDDESWELVDDSDGFKQYQCLRYPSLFKGVEEDTGKIRYVDQQRYVCIDINDPKQCWTGGIGAKILEETLPITFPYEPFATPIKVYMDRFLYHYNMAAPKDAFDSIAVTHFGMPDGQLMEIHRFFKQEYKRGDAKTQLEPELVEITRTEYFSRKKAYQERLNKGSRKKKGGKPNGKD